MTETYNENQPNQSKKSKGKMTIITAVVVLLICILGIGGFVLYKQGFFDDKNVVATVGDEKVYLKDYKEMLFTVTGKGTPENPVANPSLRELALDQAVNLRIVNKELIAEGITLSENEIVTQAKKTFSGYDAANESVKTAYRDLARSELGEKKLGEKVLTWKEGFALYCRFDRADQDDMAGKTVEAKAFKEKQRAYAEQYCQDMKDRLEKGSSSFKDEYLRLKADTTIGEEAWKPYSTAFGVVFDQTTYTPKRFSFEYDDYDQISKLKPDKENNFYTLTIKDKLRKDKGDSLFAVVNLKKSGNTGETSDMETWFKEKRNQYNVKTYIERIKK